MNKNDLKSAKKQWEKLWRVPQLIVIGKQIIFKLLCLIILVQTAKYMLC